MIIRKLKTRPRPLLLALLLLVQSPVRDLSAVQLLVMVLVGNSRALAAGRQAWTTLLLVFLAAACLN